MDQDTMNKLIESLVNERDKYKQEVSDLKEQNASLDKELKKYVTDMANYIEMTDSTISILRDEVVELKAERDSYKDAYERLLFATISSNEKSDNTPKKKEAFECLRDRNRCIVRLRASKAQEEIRKIRYGILPRIRKEEN